MIFKKRVKDNEDIDNIFPQKKPKKLSRFFRSKYFLSIICFIMAGIVAFAILPVMYSTAGDKVAVAVANTNILEGQKITKKNVVLKEMSKDSIPSNAIDNLDDAVGKFARGGIYEGDVITGAKIDNAVIDEMMAKAMNEHKKIVSVMLPNIASGCGSMLQKGDKVSVAKLIKVAGNENGAVVVAPELRGLLVYSIASADLVPVGGDAEQEIPAVVSLIVNDNQAGKLIEAQMSGKLHLIFESRGE